MLEPLGKFFLIVQNQEDFVESFLKIKRVKRRKCAFLGDIITIYFKIFYQQKAYTDTIFVLKKASVTII